MKHKTAVLAAVLVLSGANFALASVPEYVHDFIAAAVSTSQIRLSWTTPGSNLNLSGYRIQRETPIGGGFATIITDTGVLATPSYTDTNLAPNTVYNYRIYAINADGESVVSNEAAAQTQAAPLLTPPGAPGNLAVTALSGSTAKLTWTAPSGATLTGYKIEREISIGGGFSILVLNTSSTATTYTDTSLGAGGVYNYRVSGINSLGVNGNPSVSAAVTMPYPPEAPRNVAATPGDGQVKLTWIVPFYTGGGIATYKITGAPSGDITVSGTSTEAVITGLANGTAYYFSVIAMNLAGTSAPAAVPDKTVPFRTIATVYATTTASSAASSTSAASSSGSAALQAQIQALQAMLAELSAKANSNANASPVGASSSAGASIVSKLRFLKDLELGSRGDEVKALQALLIARNSGTVAGQLAAAGATGYFGPLTKKAVLEFQLSAKIKGANGRFGPLTRAYANGL